MNHLWDTLLLFAFVGGLSFSVMLLGAFLRAGWDWITGARRRRAQRPVARPLEEVFQDGARAAFAYAERQAGQLADRAKDRMIGGDLRIDAMGALADFSGRCKAWREQLPTELEDRSA